MIPFLRAPGTVFDVRSPSEYQKGHIPQAIHLPLFTDEERAAVGTTYKHSSPEHAFEQGLSFAEPKFERIIAEVSHHKHAKIYCARGGMRSAAVAQLLETSGIPSTTLEGGYKTFRNWALNLYTEPYQLMVLGGLTGSGKTAILHDLQDLGEQVLDLERLASHRGSSYGNLSSIEDQQPSTEQFQNEIAIQWTSFDHNHPIWVEDESRLIGTCHIPEQLFLKMRAAHLYCIERSLSERMERLRQDYGNTDPEKLIDATQRIAKRLGSARTKQIIEWIRTGLLRQAGEAVLEYYDTSYRYGLAKRQQPIHYLQGRNLSNKEWAIKLQTQSRVLASL